MITTLVVDDDFMVASIHRGYVERVPGFEVVGEAHSGEAALEAAQRHRPELVLLDIYLPDISGVEVLRRLRLGPPVDVIAVTAARDVATLRATMQLGSLHYLVKPFTFPMLREKLQNYAAWASALERTTITDQSEVDRLVGTLHIEHALQRTLPKGLSEETLRLIVGIVRTATSELTSTEVADLASLSRVTARRYLEYLRQTDVLTMRSKYGTSGRPVHLFSVATTS